MSDQHTLSSQVEEAITQLKREDTVGFHLTAHTLEDGVINVWYDSDGVRVNGREVTGAPLLLHQHFTSFMNCYAEADAITVVRTILAIDEIVGPQTEVEYFETREEDEHTDNRTETEAKDES